MVQIICRVVLIVLYAMNIGIYLAKDGQPKEGCYHFGDAIIGSIIIGALLIGAGTFN